MATSPDSTPNPAGAPLEADLPGFAPSRRHQLDPLDPEVTTVTTGPPPASSQNPTTEPPPPLDDDEFDDREDWSELPDPRNLRSSSRASTRDADPVVAGALEQLAKLGVTVASLALNRTLGQGNGAWIIHEEEATAIAAPLGRIGARHAPIGDGVAGDVSDGIEAGLATAGYAMRAAADHQVARTVDAPAAAGGEQQ